ncbi:MAG: CHRD domain-containing protein [Betaproteobacteria bacterium]
MLHNHWNKRATVRAMTIAGALVILGACAPMTSMSTDTKAVVLIGANEVPPVITAATGEGSVTIRPDMTVSAKIRVIAMDATAAHIHNAAAGTNGPVIVPFTKTADNTFEAPAGARLSAEQYAAFRAGHLYVNVHSAKHAGGEVRAQIIP